MAGRIPNEGESALIEPRSPSSIPRPAGMDGQAWGTLVAAVITAIAGLGGGMLARRTPYRRQQLRDMREEAELLAILPEGHAMRDRLSAVVEARINGYARIFEVDMKRPERPWFSIASGVIGVIGICWLLLGGGRDGVTVPLRRFASGEDASFDWQLALAWLLLLVGASALYFVGVKGLAKAIRNKKWREAVSWDESEPGELELWDMPPLWVLLGWEIANAARWALARLRRTGRREPVNDDVRGSEPDA